MYSIKVFIRQFKNHLLISLILLGGLVLSLTSLILIGSFVTSELSYDKFHRNVDRIVLLTQFENSTLSGGKLGTDIQSLYPQVENMARLKLQNVLVSSNDFSRYENGFYFADPSVFSIFSFNWEKGNPLNCLQSANGIVITSSAANKYFGKIDPIGKELIVNDKYRFMVEGVVADFPVQSHLDIEMLASYKSANDIVGYDVKQNYWGPGANTYFLLKDATQLKALQANFKDYVASLNDPNATSVWKLNLVPLRDLYLRSSLIGVSPISYVYIFSGAGLLILLLAGFNYINLTTARATVRSHEVGVRKILGASLTGLRMMFVKEACLMILFALFLAFLISYALMPWLSRVSGWELSFQQIILPGNIIVALFVLIGFIVLSALYPAWLLSTGKPFGLLKGSIQFSIGKINVRRFLVAFQFAVSAFMIVVTLCVYRQLEYIQNKNLGYNRVHVLTLDFRNAEAQSKSRFKQQILQLPNVKAASLAFALPGSNMFQGQKLFKDLVPNGSNDGSIIRLTLDNDYTKTFGIKLVDGRLLNEKNPADRGKFLINKAALNYFGWNNLEGKIAGYYSYQYNQDGSYNEVPILGEVVGVIDDYHHNDLKSAIKPIIFSLNEGYESKMGIRIASENIQATVNSINKVWMNVFPNQPFEYAFMDDVFNKTYASEIRTGKVFGGFAIVAVVISCLGLFGLVYFALQRRLKEISIRKVLGASFGSISAIFSKEFMVLAMVSSCIGLPFAWFGITKWLQNFAYHFSFEWWLLLAPVVLLSILVAITLFAIVYRAAASKPVKYLRTE